MEATLVIFATRYLSALDLTDNQKPDHAHRRFHQDKTGVIRPDYDPPITSRFLTSDPAPEQWLLFGCLKYIKILAMRDSLSDALSESILYRMAQAKPELI